MPSRLIAGNLKVIWEELRRHPSRQGSYATKSHRLQLDAPHLPRKFPFLFDVFYPRLIHSSLDRPHSPSQTVSRSNQPFCHSTPSGQTDRQTDTSDRRQVCSTKSRLRLIVSDAANNGLFSARSRTILTWLAETTSP